jgi:hypothetical protein
MWAGTQAEREAMILDLAEKIDADLIAVGSRGMGPIKRLALGSVSTKVVRAARDPVLVYSYSRTQDRDYLYERRERMPATIGVKEAESIYTYCGVECNFTLGTMQCMPLDRVSTKLLRAKVGEG